MDAFTKQKWVEALRSGEYKQCRRALHRSPIGNFNSHSYCCLGVVLKVVDPETNHPWDYSLLGKKKIDLSGDQIELCMIMNDDDSYSFKEIADVIEKEF